MPHRFKRNTKSKQIRKLNPYTPQTIAEGVKAQRNGIIIDASVCKAFNNWSASHPQEEDHPEEDREHAPHEDGGTEGGIVPE